MTMRALTPLAAATLILALVACASPSPPPSTDATAAAPSRASSSVAPMSAPPSSPLELPTPGRPYEASDLLDAMRDSRRPGGVPAELQVESIAAELAERTWTIDGNPWEAVAAGGSCGPGTCTLELSGAAAGSAGEDVWTFSVNPTSGAVEVVSADLHAVPTALAASLDRLARTLDGEGRLDGLLNTSARWLPPPADDRYLLAYRSGDEEESCSIDLELDAVAGAITRMEASDC